MALSMAVSMVVATASPGFAATYPKPLDEQWWFTTWGVQDRLWPISQGQGVTIALLDSGVEAGLPDLSGVVLAGTNASGGSGDGRTDVDEADVPGHGTGMASLIAAQGRSTGFVGVAPRAKILPVVVRGLVGTASAIRYAVDHKAGIVNISQAAAGACPKDVQEAVGYALQRDVVVVAGAGNEGDTSNASMYPANCAGVLAVGAVDNRFRPWNRTQRQPYVTIAAPGAQVGALLKDGEVHPSAGGTSQATALTSAAVALVRSKYPKMTARDVVTRIIASAGDVGRRGKDVQTGHGLIRPYRALTQAPPKTARNPVFDGYDRWAAAGGKGSGAGGANTSSPESSDSGASNPVLIGAGMAVVPVGLIVFFLIRRRRRPRPGAPHPAAPHPAAPYPGAPHSAAPPSFGGPYPPAPPRPGAVPPGRQGPPPGRGHVPPR